MNGIIELNGKEYRFVPIPNLKIASRVQHLGFANVSQEKFEKILGDPAELEKLEKNWPDYINTIIEGDKAGLEFDNLTVGEVGAIVTGFTVHALQVRKVSKVG